mgnify:CR=1 FL=1|jgi:hypothetical protein
MRRVLIFNNKTKEVLYEGYLIQFINDKDDFYALVELDDGTIIIPYIQNIKFKYPTEGET